MAKPITNLALTPLAFEQRLKLVTEEIQRRKQATKPVNPSAFVARYWVQWLKKNVLDVPAQGVEL